MPTYVAFLRAINLGPTRQFPKADIAAATQAAGGVDVQTYSNTGNVRLTSALRSTAAVRHALEAAYAADRGFEVPTIVLTTAELVEVAARGSRMRARSVAGARHYVTLYAQVPQGHAVDAVEALSPPGERCVVRGRAAHALLDGDLHGSALLESPEFRALGVGTARTINVLTTLAARWG